MIQKIIIILVTLNFYSYVSADYIEHSNNNQFLASMDSKHICSNYCCRNILYFVTKEIDNEKGLITVRHAGDCSVLNNTQSSKIRAIIKNRENDDVLCEFCKEKRLNYGKTCNNWCCNHYEYVVDFNTGLIHMLNCEIIKKKMMAYDAMFKPKNYNLIDGYKKMGYSGLCPSCMVMFSRLN